MEQANLTKNDFKKHPLKDLQDGLVLLLKYMSKCTEKKKSVYFNKHK